MARKIRMYRRKHLRERQAELVVSRGGRPTKKNLAKRARVEEGERRWR